MPNEYNRIFLRAYFLATARLRSGHVEYMAKADVAAGQRRQKPVANLSVLRGFIVRNASSH